MGRNDIGLKLYLSEKRRFADLFNCTLMGGSQIIDPRRLEASSTVMPASDENGFMERINDISMCYTFGGTATLPTSHLRIRYIEYDAHNLPDYYKKTAIMPKAYSCFPHN